MNINIDINIDELQACYEMKSKCTVLLKGQRKRFRCNCLAEIYEHFTAQFISESTKIETWSYHSEAWYISLSIVYSSKPTHTTTCYFQTVLDDATTAWGIKVERVEM